MKTVLFLGHDYHLKTKSSRFFIDLLKEKYDVSCVFFDPYTNRYSEDDVQKRYDFLVLWQIMPERYELEKRFQFEQGILIPMYDSVVESNIDWMQYCDFKALCFCKKLCEPLAQCGIDTMYVQYFIGFDGEFQPGNEESVFFWQRKESINTKTIELLLKNTDIKHLHLHKALDPLQSFELSKTLKWDVTFSDWFEQPEDYKKCVLNSALYIAPREYEGIGMSFLEAMAMGRCVIAPDNPTMNEYIEDGITGILYDEKDRKPIGEYDIKKIQKNAYEYSKEGYRKWETEKGKILEWMETKGDLPKYAVQYLPLVVGRQREKCKQNLYYSILNQWLALRQRDRNLDTFFEGKDIKTVAVYGMRDLGERLCEELSQSRVSVAYGIDKNPFDLKQEFEVLSPEDDLPQVDAIVVTSVFYFDEIQAVLEKKTDCPVISLQEIIERLGE